MLKDSTPKSHFLEVLTLCCAIFLAASGAFSQSVPNLSDWKGESVKKADGAKPAEGANKRTGSPKVEIPVPGAVIEGVDAVQKITSREEFDRVARTYHESTPFALPHAMFVVDRRDGDKIYFVNTRKFKFHKDFLYATGLAPLGADIYKIAYFADDRRFIVGTIAWQKPVDKWTWELWEGDLAGPVHLKTAAEAIKQNFFEPVSFKPNSTRQDDNARTAGLAVVTQDEINKGQEYLPLNTGSAIGRVHIIDKLDDTVEIGDNEIVILRELPETLPPVAGIVVAKPSTPLSHVNILAKGWGIPNVYIKDADKLFKELDTRWIKFDANLTGYEYKFADKDTLDAYRPPNIRQAPANLGVRKLATLRELKKEDSIAYGGKSANLGEMTVAKIPDVTVPDGFAVPFFWYDRYVKANRLDQVIENLVDDINFVHNPRYRRQRLEELRTQFLKGRMDPDLQRQIVSRWRMQLKGRPVFVRSSSNAEDLPNFSGAGLYSSVANVTKEDQLIEAVKKVWASLWKFEAYEARVRNYVDQQSVYMSVLVQTGIDMERGGVMFSKDPFDRGGGKSVYISAVCGHNDPITANGGMPEQILVNAETDSIVTLTYSQLANALRFDGRGGLKETEVACSDPKSRRILSDQQARSLAGIASEIKKLFGGVRDQDIEWGIIRNRIYIIQARPYFEKK